MAVGVQRKSARFGDDGGRARVVGADAENLERRRFIGIVGIGQGQLAARDDAGGDHAVGQIRPFVVKALKLSLKAETMLAAGNMTFTAGVILGGAIG